MNTSQYFSPKKTRNKNKIEYDEGPFKIKAEAVDPVKEVKLKKPKSEIQSESADSKNRYYFGHDYKLSN